MIDIEACMEKVRLAVAAAPSHEEIFAGIEAMLRHVVAADEKQAPANDTTPPKKAG